MKRNGHSHACIAVLIHMWIDGLVPFHLLPFCLLPFRLLIVARCHFAYSCKMWLKQCEIIPWLIIILEAAAGKWLELDRSSPRLVASSSLLPYWLQSPLHLGGDCAHWTSRYNFILFGSHCSLALSVFGTSPKITPSFLLLIRCLCLL